MLIEALQFLEVVGRKLRGRRGPAGGFVGFAVVHVGGAGAVGLGCGLLLDRNLAAELVRKHNLAISDIGPAN